MHEFFANFLFRDDLFSHMVAHYLVLLVPVNSIFIPVRSFLVLFVRCFGCLPRPFWHLALWPFASSAAVQLDCLSAKTLMQCNAKTLYRVLHFIHCIKVKWCAQYINSLHAKLHAQLHGLKLHLIAYVEATKKNQLSLRSGGIRGASFVVLYAALACAACLLAVPRSMSPFSFLQFRRQNVAKPAVNSFWVHSSSSGEFLQITSDNCCLHRWWPCNENPEYSYDLHDPKLFSLAMRLQWCHVLPEEHILKQRHVSHHQSELYWVAILAS